MPAFLFRLLGPPLLVSEGRSVSLQRRKSTALLAYLSIERHPHGRDELAALFWPDHGQSRARANLRRSIFSLNQILGRDAFQNEQDTVLLSARALTTDAERFVALAAGCGAHPRDEVCESCAPLLEDALLLYRNDFLTGFSLPDCSLFDEWQLARGEQFRGELSAVLRRLVSIYEADRRWDSAIDCARRLVEVDRLEESSHRALIRLLAASGRRNAALRQYQECVRILAEELEAGPEQETSALEAAVRAQEEVRGPAGTGKLSRVEAERGERRVLLLSDYRSSETASARQLQKLGGQLWPGWWGNGAAMFSTVEAAMEAGAFLLREDRSACAVIHIIERNTMLACDLSTYHAYAMLEAATSGDFLVSAAAASEVHGRLPDGFSLESLGLLRLADLSAPAETDRIVYPGFRKSPGGVRSLESVPNNLPVPDTTLIGRKATILRIVSLLESEAVRLLTVTGPAGAGKTRVSLHVSALLARRFPDGVFFIDLTSLRLASELPAAVIAALGMQESAYQRRPPGEVVSEYLRRRTALLVMDNFEHLLDAAPEAARLLQECAGVKILVTSRSPLGLAGEREYQLPALDLPADDGADAAIVESEAVQLFLERASRHTRLVLTDRLAATIAQLCRRLDALPLAIELAAPQLKFSSPEELLNRLTDQPVIRTTGFRDLPERQQTLDAAIRWSYDLLDEELKRLFRSLSVFVGGWSLDAASSICASEDESTSTDILGGLGALIDQSLVAREPSDGSTRFRLLETIRGFARSLLVEAGEMAALRCLHAAYFFELALQAEASLHGSEARVWLQRLENEYGNIDAAMRWYETDGSPEESVRFAVALEWYWFLCGRFADGRAYLERGLERLDVAGNESLAGRALHALGFMHFVEGGWRISRTLHTRALSLFRAADDRAGESLALSDLGVTERFSGNYSEGTLLTEAAVRAAEEVGDPRGIARALIWAYATTGGKYPGEPPVAKLETALRITRKTGDEWAYAHVRNGLGDLYREAGDYGAARLEYEESLSHMKSMNDRWMIAWNYEGLGRTAALQADPVESLQFYRQALRLFDSLGDQGNSLFLTGRIATALVAARRPEPAAELLGALELLRVPPPGTDGGGPDADGQSWGVSADLEQAIDLCRVHHPEAWARGRLLDYQTLVERVEAILDEIPFPSSGGANVPATPRDQNGERARHSDAARRS